MSGASMSPAGYLPLVVGGLWLVLMLVAVLKHRAPPRRLRELTRARALDRQDRLRMAGRETLASAARVADSAAVVPGRVIRWAVGLAGDPQADRQLGFAVMVALAVAACSSMVLAVPAGAAVWLVPRLARTAVERRRRESVLAELPEFVDLLRLALGSGRSLRLALLRVAPLCGPAIGSYVRRIEGQLDRGLPLVEALDSLVPLGEPFQPLLDALRLSELRGAPIANLLDRIAADSRTARRRRAEELARRIPVKLLFPLVFCTLPAFGLLTVVPLVASTVGRMSL